MREHPILFSAPMVRAILEGRKTQTRRIWKQPTDLVLKGDYLYKDAHAAKDGWNPIAREEIICPYGRTGDHLWVRETFSDNGKRGFLYRATDGEMLKWKPSIYMPRRASRIDLLIKTVRVERLHDITEEDALAEGVQDDLIGTDFSSPPPGPGVYIAGPITWFAQLWSRINGIENWRENPWVWVIEFERIKNDQT